MSDGPTPIHDLAFLESGGELGALMRAHDWSGPPLGPPETWPQPLKTLVGVMLAASQPMFVAWGPQRILLYNDAYAEILASKHPTALGQDLLEVWDEICADLTPIVERAYAGRPVHMDDIELVMRRRGHPEEAHFAFSYTPVRDEAGDVAGFFCPCLEITEQVFAKRRTIAERERLARMFDQAPGFMTMLRGPEHVFELVNAAYMQLVGHRDVLDKPVRDALPEVEGQGFFELLDDVYATGEPFVGHSMPVDLQRQPGAPVERRFVDLVYQPITDAEGAVTGIFVEGSDVTERVVGEIELRESEARQRFRLKLEERLRDLADPGMIKTEATVLLGEHLGADRVGYSEIVDDRIVRTAGSYVANGVAPLNEDFPIESFGAARIARQRQGITEVSDDVRAEPGETDDVWDTIDTRSVVSVPLVRDGRFVASLFVTNRAPRRWSREEVALIEETAARTWDAVERARAEAGRRALAERNGEILESVSDAFYAVDRDWRFTYVNSRTEEWWGRKREDLIGRVYWEEFPQAVGSEPHKAHLRAMATREVVRLETVSPILGHWVDISIYPTADGGLSVYFRDISRKKRAEERLRESEARYRTLFETIDAGFCVIEVMFDAGERAIDYRFVEANPAFERQTGLQDVAGRTARELVPNLEPHWFKAYGRVALTGEAVRFEDGSAAMGRWFDVHALRVGEPQARRVAILFNDISARRDVEERLRELNDTLEARVVERTAERNRLWNLSEDMLAWADYGGMMTAVSPAWTRVLGWSEAELLSRPYAAFMHPDDMDATLASLARMGETGEPARFENRIATKDGAWKPIEWTVAPESDGTNFIAVGRDVSLAREREAALALAEEQLRQSQKLDAMGQLTGGVAHDFNNLLTPIIGSLDMLTVRGVGNERERRLIDGALQSAERAKTLVQRLLAFARRQPLQPGPVDLRRLVGGMAELVASTSGPKVEVRVEMPDDLPPATADANQLEMAVLNLAVNARDAMPEGGVLTISGSREAVRPERHAKLRPGHYVRLSVKDTGVGMDEATLSRAVEPFFSTKGVGRGTGLGLSMVHGLALQLNGDLKIASRPGGGTTVELWLPISAVAADEDDRTYGDVAARKTRGVALLVDDEEFVRMSTADMLTDLGYDVVEASSAEEALRLIGEGVDPNLLVTDHLMPGMSGEDLARELRFSRPDLPILIVSGYAEISGIALGLPRLTKPFRSAELAASVAALAPAGAQ